MIKRYSNKSLARKTKVRAKLKRFGQKVRLSVFRSQKLIYAQIINDEKGETLVSASEKDLKNVGAIPCGRPSKIGKAFQVGQILAKKALKKKIKQVYFDRGSYKYHGRVKALAEGARKGGLEF